MANRSERQLHESVQKALMKYFSQVKEPTAQQLEVIKALFFFQKKDIFAVLPTGHGKSFTIFQAGLMELQVKELQKADLKASCLHNESGNEKQLMEGKYSIVYGKPEVP